MPEETLKPCHCGQQDYCIGQAALLPGITCKIAAWDTGPKSELERLAREVATVYRGMQATGKQQTHTIFDVLDSCSNLAAHFAGQHNKGKTE